MKNPIRTGTMIAMTAATLFAAACGGKSSSSSDTTPTAPAATEQTAAASVNCQGINECKGQGSCKTAANECKGQNSCKGTGIVEAASAEECTGKGGTVADAAAH
jgi:hypothetical protein